MNENPYNSPCDVVVDEATGSDDVFIGERPRGRPVGVLILAVLQLIGGGLVVLGPASFLFTLSMAPPEALHELRTEHILVVANMAGIGVVMLASAIGMWTGAQWGWWLGAFNYVYSLLEFAATLLAAALMTGGLGASTGNPEYTIPRQALRVAVCALIAFYFFQGNVLEYFGLRGLGRLKALGILVAIAAVLAVAITLGTTVSS